MSENSVPSTGTAQVHVLLNGYAGLPDDDERVASTVTLIVDGDVVIIVDPGMVASRERLIEAVRDAGQAPGTVTDVVFSHHHPDHTMNAALFPNARIHDHWAIYEDDHWTDRDANGFELSPSVRLLRTPGHTNEDISTVVSTPEGVYVCTHAWWNAEVGDDPLAVDPAALKRSRERLLGLAKVIVPGHGAPFDVSSQTQV
jgi:glyoxylase-like metal-dependent hydrolase (beta-lactamase superfamily II)